MATIDTTDKLWTAKEVAAYLAVSRSWVYQRAEAGDLPCLRLGALLRFEPDEIRAWPGCGRVTALLATRSR